jgi:membrane associated rhomboid family serine protease
MLILPLHKPLNRQTLPWITLLLILINCWVYFALQVPAQRKSEQAVAYYLQANLGEHEIPAFIAHILPSKRRAQFDAIAMIDEPWRTHLLLGELQADTQFQQLLREGKVLPPLSTAALESYQQRRKHFETLWQRGNFTERYAHRTGTFNVLTMFTSTFLHGGFEHLLGNMVMLLIVGLLVEGALARHWFLLVYLGAGVAASFACELWRYGSPITGLGASGAIAGLMGALPVLWGLRRVRVFYWLGFYFDYAHVPALVLLPIWLGKEVYSLLTSLEPIGFDAHAGGMLAGALFCWALSAFGRVNSAFFEEGDTSLAEQATRQTRASFYAMHAASATNAQTPHTPVYDPAAQARALAEGIKALGQLEFSRAHTLLSALAAHEQRAGSHKQRLDILLPAYRAARFGPGGAAASTAARRVLLARAVEPTEIHALHDVWLDLAKSAQAPTGAHTPMPLSDTEQLHVASLWLQGGFLRSAEPMLLALASLTSDKRFDGALLKPAMVRFANALSAIGDPRATRITAFAERLG